MWLEKQFFRCFQKEVQKRMRRQRLPEYLLYILAALYLFTFTSAEISVILPDRCESCVLFARELEDELLSKNNKKVIGWSFQCILSNDGRANIIIASQLWKSTSVFLL